MFEMFSRWLVSSFLSILILYSVNNTKITRSWLIFHFSIQRLPLSQATVLCLTTPIIASVVARFVLHENYKIADVGGM